jgi:hypothetical protein
MYPNPFKEMDPYRGMSYVQPEYFSNPPQPHLNQHQIQAWYEYMAGSKGGANMMNGGVQMNHMNHMNGMSGHMNHMNGHMNGHMHSHGHMHSQGQMNGYQGMNNGPSQGGTHYFTHLNNSNSTPSSSSSLNLDQLNLSRTIILKNIIDDVSLSDLLDKIDFGPIEYCKIFSKATPQHLIAQNPGISKNLKTCYVSFINSSLSIQFHIKYVKNLSNLNKLKELLGPYLKIVLNDNSNNLQQDFIKLKTLNYIVEFNATRCLMLKFDVSADGINGIDSINPTSSISDNEIVTESAPSENAETTDGEIIVETNATPGTGVESTESTELTKSTESAESTESPVSVDIPNDPSTDAPNNVSEEASDIDTSTNAQNSQTHTTSNASPTSSIKQFIHNQCTRFGDVEELKISLAETPDSRNRFCGKALVHFTSIDAAIKTYESYLRRINHDKHRVMDPESLDSTIALINKRKDSYLVHVQYDIKFSQANFHKDRCDKTSAPLHKSSLKKHDDSVSFVPTQQDFETSSPEVLSPKGGSDSLLLADDDLNDSLIRDNFLVDAINPNKDPLLALPLSPTLSSSTPDHASTSPSNSPHLRGSNMAGPYISSSSPLLPPNLYRSHSQQGQLYHHGPPPPHPYMVQHSTMIPQTPRNPSVPQAAPSNYQLNPDPFNVGNRTIYLGNLHVNSTIEEIANNVRAGGLVESIKYHPEKRVCFITFVDPTVALKFYLNHQVLHQLIVHGHDITVGWAKNHSGPLSREISLAVTAGASRNVYIGIKLVKDAPVQDGAAKLKLPNEATLRKDFSMFGLLEQINFYHNKDCGFLNFLNILDAIRLVECFEIESHHAIERLTALLDDCDHTTEETGGETDNHATATAFYHKYKEFKISFAKDRCGNSPKFSFKKKSTNVYGSTYQQYLHLLHDNLQKRNRYKNQKGPNDTYDEELRMQEHDSFMEDTINEEAAMVFGIIRNSEKKDLEVSKEEVAEDKESQVSDNEDDDDEEEDEEVSIIIGGEESSPSSASANEQKTETKKKQNHQNHNQRINNHQKVYHNKYNMSDSYLPMKKSSMNSSSNVSLNNSFQHYGNQQAPPYLQSSPYMLQQQLLYFPNQSRPGTRSIYGYLGASTPTQGFFPAQQYTPLPQYYPPQPHHHVQLHQHQQKPNNQYVTSGSQVMAQYLAKSQQDSLLYAVNAMNNDAGFDEDIESYDYDSPQSSERLGSFSSQKSRMPNQRKTKR